MKPRTDLLELRTFWLASASFMSNLCGFGPNQWRLYESGEATPSRSNELLIHSIRDVKVFQQMLLLMPVEHRDKGTYVRILTAAQRINSTIQQLTTDYGHELSRAWIANYTLSVQKLSDTQP